MRCFVFMFVLMLSFISGNRPARSESLTGDTGPDSVRDNLDRKEIEDRAVSSDAACRDWTVKDGKVFVQCGDGRVDLPLPGAALEILIDGSQLYAALGSLGAVVFDISVPTHPRPVRDIPAADGEITGFARIDGEVWTRNVTTKIVPILKPMQRAALPVSETASAETTARSAAESKGVEKREIRILQVSRGEVTLNVGKKDGVRVGDRFSIFRSIQVKGEGGERFKGTELAAVAEVVAVSADRCLADLWRGDRAGTEDTVEVRLPAHRRSLMFPRHLTDIGEANVSFRPFLNVDGPLGFGAVTDLSVSYFGKGYFVGIRLGPLGFAYLRDGSALVLNFSGEAGYDARAFAIGLGAGFDMVTYESNAFSLAQIARLGPRDGLHLVLRNTFNLRKHPVYDDDYTEETEELGFEWGGMTGRMSIPLTGRTALFFEGGGNDHYFFSTMGVDAWVIGNGDAGSLGISVAAGAAGIFVNNYGDTADYEDETALTAIGPMVSLGLNYRFGFKHY